MYVRGSTANPTGWRPWNSRLSFYIENSFPLPTAGRGKFLVNGGGCGCPSANGGLGVHFPNYAGQRSAPANYRSRQAVATQPYIYATPEAVQNLNGLGVQTATHRIRQPRAGSSASSTATPTTPPNWGGGQRPQPEQWGQGGSQGQGQFQISSPETGSIVSYVPNSSTPIYDSNGNVIGYGSASPSAANAALTSTPQAGTAATTTPAASSFDFSTWLSEDSLGLGLNNGIYTAAGVLFAMWAMKGKR